MTLRFLLLLLSVVHGGFAQCYGGVPGCPDVPLAPGWVHNWTDDKPVAPYLNFITGKPTCLNPTSIPSAHVSVGVGSSRSGPQFHSCFVPQFFWALTDAHQGTAASISMSLNPSPTPSIARQRLIATLLAWWVFTAPKPKAPLTPWCVPRVGSVLPPTSSFRARPVVFVRRAPSLRCPARG